MGVISQLSINHRVGKKRHTKRHTKRQSKRTRAKKSKFIKKRR